jgi:fluoroquinolone resistance protein
MKYFTDETFENEENLDTGEYENCVFKQCDLENMDLSGFKFRDCLFRDSNLSLVKLDNTTVSGVTFNSCKMLGLRFDNCNQFDVSFTFDQCQLNHSSFFQVRMKKVIFKDSLLEEVDFTGADMTNAMLDYCNLVGAMFERTILEKADLSTSFNYSIDPENNRLKKAKFSISGISGLLDKYDIIIDQ